MTDLHYARHSVTSDDAKAVVELLGSGRALTQGPAVEEFEQALCDYTGSPYAVVVNSGTAALHLAYGLVYQPGQSIRMPAISFAATANAALYCGLKPEFLDVSPRTGLVMEDCDVGVELGGQPTGHRHTIVDGCHSLRYVPSALVTVLSTHPAKHVCTGEGGAILTGNKELADKARILRSHGRIGTEMHALGFNYRMPDILAVLGLSQLQGVKARIEARIQLARRYDELIAPLDVTIVPHSPDSHRHLYQILVKNRESVRARLKERGIGTAIHYPCIPDLLYYRNRFGHQEGLGWARDFASQTLSLPLFPGLREEDQVRVVDALKESL